MFSVTDKELELELELELMFVRIGMTRGEVCESPEAVEKLGRSMIIWSVGWRGPESVRWKVIAEEKSLRRVSKEREFVRKAPIGWIVSIFPEKKFACGSLKEMARVRRSSVEEPEEEVKEEVMPTEGRVMLFSERMSISIDV
jgi:hypothetical protein